MDAEIEKVAEFINLRSPGDRSRLVCACVKRCYERGERVAVYVSDTAQARELAGMLWTFEDRAFIPHVCFAEAEDPLIEPVVIYSGQEAIGEADVLIEAAGGESGERFQRFAHVFDFAETYDEQLRELSRRRYRACQEAGYRMRFIE